MNTKTPAQTPEGRLIEERARVSGRSIRTLAAKAEISDTRWRHIVKGWQSSAGGVQAPVRAPAPTLARMAHVLGISAEDLELAGREDAVPELRRLEAEQGQVVAHAGTAEVTGQAFGAVAGPLDEIEMIYASHSMSAAEKLAAIRMVLQLRAQVDGESAGPTPSS